MAADGRHVVGIWLNAGMLTGPYARYGTVVLGGLLVIYAALGLSKISFKVARRDEKWIGGIVGADHRRRVGRHRRAGDPVDALSAGDRDGEGRTGAGARRVLHGRHGGARLRSHRRRASDGATALPGAVAMAARLPACLLDRRCGRGCSRRCSAAGS